MWHRHLSSATTDPGVGDGVLDEESTYPEATPR